MLDLISVGDVKLDTFIVIHDASVKCELKMPDCKLCLAYGEKIPVEAFVTQIAGSAPNVAVGAARMGLSTSVLSHMGEDDVYNQALHFLSKNKVDSSNIKTKKNIRSSAAVVLNFKGESTQLVDFVPQEYHLPAKILATNFLHICEVGDGYEHLYKDAVLQAKKGIRISLNPGAIQIKEKKRELFDLLATCEVLFVNQSEARVLLEKEGDTIHGIMAMLKALGPKYVVVTDGPQGAYAFDGKQLNVVPAFPGTMKEATGAGDAFATGFLGALIKGKTHREALRWGSVNSASVIEHVGPTLGLLTHTEIAKRLRAHPSFQTKEL
ncbi:MAG: carbohydrate kinase family protein [Patescibacteria group bacterium]|jgi:sugar/nucleoside kinase (ribokinase family)